MLVEVETTVFFHIQKKTEEATGYSLLVYDIHSTEYSFFYLLSLLFRSSCDFREVPVGLVALAHSTAIAQHGRF
jgi:hypothetical protein